MRSWVQRSAAALLALLAAPVAALAADVTQLDQADPMTWLTKSVCTDASGRLLPVDPYGGCPAGAGIRKLQPGDWLPYHNIEQEGYQQRDGFPVTNPINGNTWIIATYDYQPFDRFNLYNQTDGYDIYRLNGAWAVIANTSDGGGYGQTFYGIECTLDNGWLLFPQQNFLAGGAAIQPIHGVYWEQDGQSYPGACPTSYSTDTQTSWRYQPGFAFGGVNGHPVKTMDTLISYHGFIASPGFPYNGHMEVNYFTREYGPTRWEVWTPTAQNPVASGECQGTGAVRTYQGLQFVVQNCHDWSVVTPATAAQIPLWPIPNVNLLAKPHFDGNVAGVWKPLGRVQWNTALSTAPRDAANGPGVAYLAVACAAPRCSGFANALYQDIPAAALLAGNYGFGINARSEPVGNTATSGAIGVELEELGPRGNVLGSDRITAVLASDNGNAPSPGEFQSVYLSSAFVGKVTALARNPGATTVRFLIAPQGRQKIDVLDAWLAPWPVPAAGP